jgi:hypothetical protein
MFSEISCSEWRAVEKHAFICSYNPTDITSLNTPLRDYDTKAEVYSGTPVIKNKKLIHLMLLILFVLAFP